MNDRTDRPTPIERQGAPDCLVELGMSWLSQPLHALTEMARSTSIAEMCLLISQMRHRDSRIMDVERRRWIERVAVRLCQQCAHMSGYEGSVQLGLEQIVTSQMLQYHRWREQVAPVVARSITTGPSEGGEIHA